MSAQYLHWSLNGRVVFQINQLDQCRFFRYFVGEVVLRLPVKLDKIIDLLRSLEFLSFM